MEQLFNSLLEFNKAFKIRTHLESGTLEEQIALNKLRYSLAEEELHETFSAAMDGDYVSIYDGLIDQLYILIGTMVHYGFSPEMIIKGFEEVHRSNMSKLGKDGKPMYNEKGKVMKGPDYFRPDLEKILTQVIESSKKIS